MDSQNDPPPVVAIQPRWQKRIGWYLGLFTPDSLTRSLAVYLTTNGLLRAGGVMRGVVLTWLMLQQEFGIYQLGLLLINVLLPLFSTGLYDGIARYIPQYEARGELRRFIFQALVFSAMIGLGVCCVAYLLLPIFSGAVFGSLAAFGEQTSSRWATQTDEASLARVVVLTVASLVIYHLILAVLRGQRYFRAVSWMELSAGVIFTIPAILIATLGGGSAERILGLYALSNVASAAAFGGVALWGVYRRTDTPQMLNSKVELRGLWRFSIWAGLGAVLWQLVQAYPAWHLNRLAGTQSLATFSGMKLFAQLSQLAPAAMSVAILGAVSKTWESAGRAAALQQLELATKAGLGAVVVLSLWVGTAGKLLVYLFSAEYRGGAAIIPPLLLSHLLAGGLSLITIRLQLLENSRTIFAGWLAGCGVAVLSSFLLIEPNDPSGALIGAGWSGVWATATVLVVVLVDLGRGAMLPNRGTLLILAAMWFLAAPAGIMWAGSVILLLLMFSTRLILSSDEKQQLLQLFRNFRTALHKPLIADAPADQV
ncbi:MAG: hypothetical protein HJJLKODD_02208 [Phycisphaerae bacterium]|nr:hypothetical protein [Phycisphaerae bacterium]